MNRTDQYLLRNLKHASAVGLCAGLSTIICRLKLKKHQQKWLLRALDENLQRANALPGELAAHRDEIKP